jgi:hypothetical protein
MSTLGHVLFLLPFSLHFAHSGCIASFLTTSGFSPVGFTRHRRDVKKGNLLCSHQPIVDILFVDILFVVILFVDILFADTLCESGGADRAAFFSDKFDTAS